MVTMLDANTITFTEDDTLQEFAVCGHHLDYIDRVAFPYIFTVNIDGGKTWCEFGDGHYNGGVISPVTVDVNRAFESRGKIVYEVIA